MWMRAKLGFLATGVQIHDSQDYICTKIEHNLENTFDIGDPTSKMFPSFAKFVINWKGVRKFIFPICAQIFTRILI